MKIKLSLRVIYLCLWEKEMNWDCQMNAQAGKGFLRKWTEIVKWTVREKRTKIIAESAKKLIRKRTKVADSIKISH